MRFVTLKAQGGAFSPKALASYDHKVVTRVIEGDLPDFVSGDTTSVEFHLSAEHISLVERMLSSNTQYSGGSSSNPPGSGRNRRRRQRGGGGGGPRNDWPNHVCWKWNNTQCDFDPCRTPR